MEPSTPANPERPIACARQSIPRRMETHCPCYPHFLTTASNSQHSSSFQSSHAALLRSAGRGANPRSRRVGARASARSSTEDRHRWGSNVRRRVRHNPRSSRFKRDPAGVWYAHDHGERSGNVHNSKSPVRQRSLRPEKGRTTIAGLNHTG